MHRIEFEHSHITGVELVMSGKKDDSVTSVVKMAGLLTPEAARALGCEWLFLDPENGVPRVWRKSIELDAEFDDVQVNLAPRGLEQHAIRIIPARLTRFKVGSDLLVNFHVECGGNPLEMVAYWLKVRRVDSYVAIESTQQELFESEEPEQEPDDSTKVTISGPGTAPFETTVGKMHEAAEPLRRQEG
jgi:hypothetical protein